MLRSFNPCCTASKCNLSSSDKYSVIFGACLRISISDLFLVSKILSGFVFNRFALDSDNSLIFGFRKSNKTFLYFFRVSDDPMLFKFNVMSLMPSSERIFHAIAIISASCSGNLEPIASMPN